MDRRKFLKLATASITPTLAGCMDRLGFSPDDPESEPPPRSPTETDSPTTSPTETAHPDYTEEQGPPVEDRFKQVVNVKELGASEDSSLFPIIQDHFTDETLFILPPGRYMLDETVRFREFDTVGFVGYDAVIVPDEGFTGYFFDLGRPGEATDLLFHGITFDFRASNAGSRPLSALIDDGLIVRDINVIGRQGPGGEGLRFDITDEHGTGLIERAWLPDGSSFESNANGCLVGENHRGEISFVNCHFEGFPDNGLYADPEFGRVLVTGGYYANCEVSCVRVGNDSVVRDVRVRCDTASEDYNNMRGIRLTNADGALVENCTVEMIDVPGSDGGIVFGKSLASATVKNTEITIDADRINAIQAKHAEDAPADEPITVQDVAIAGAAAEQATIEVHERENCTFEGITISQGGQERDGFVFDNSDAVVNNCQVDVTGRPIALVGDSNVSVTNSMPTELNDIGDRNS